MIILKTLKWSNCFSYGSDNELKLDDSTLTQIVGVNGVGKSSIPLILEEILFNKNSKGTKKTDIPNRYVGDTYSMELAFSVDNDEYLLITDRKKALKVKLLKNGEDISSHTATNTFNTIEEIIGVDFKTFSQLIYQNTNSSLQFLTATDTNRKKFLIDLLNLDKYVEYFEVFKEAVKEYNTKVIATNSKMETLDKWLKDNTLSNMKFQPLLENTISTDDLERALSELRLEYNNIAETNKRISKNNHYKEELSKIDLASVSNVSITELLSYDKENAQVGALTAEKKSLEALVKKIKSLGDKCPTCEQDVPASFKNDMLTDTLMQVDTINSQVLHLQAEINKIKEQNKLFNLKQSTQREFETLYRSINSSLPEIPLDAKALSSKINQLQAQLDEDRLQIKKIVDENIKRERNNTKIAIITEQREGFQKQLEEVSKEIVQLQNVYTNLEILKKSFSTNGLLAYKIENLVKELEVLVNEYLGELSDGRFSLGFVVVNDKLNVEITDNGNPVDIIALSSGELARVNTATLLAIRRLMNSISKSQINVLFLDEVIAVLDETGRDKLVEVLLKEDRLNTFIVSHQWTHPLLTKLHIIKENNMSRIEDDR
jgi:DNA repair exonuclease SbcCD ATPase subunit